MRAVVPPNTTAVVDLPAAVETVRGRLGHARMAHAGGPGIRAPAAAGARRHRCADVIDDPRAYRALLDTLAAIDPQRAEAVRAETLWGANRTVGSALMFMPPPVKAQVDEALRAATS